MELIESCSTSSSTKKLTLKEIVNNENINKHITHSYSSVYELLLKNKNIKNIIEIGNFEVNSIKLWYDYFPTANIYSFHLNPNELSESSEFKDERIKYFASNNIHTNAYEQSFIDSIKEVAFDFALNNGPHTLDSMKQFINTYLPLIKDDGLLIIEGIQDIKWLDELSESVSYTFKKNIKTYDLRGIKNKDDDILFIIDKSINKPNKINTSIIDMCLVINTCKQYSSNIDKLIKQINLYNNVFPKENILFVSGQEDENSIEYIEGFKYVKIKYSGIHLTSSIYIYENKKEYSNINYWALLPDTIMFGPNFFNLIFNYYTQMKKNNQYTLPFISPMVRPTMDMGIVNTKHIVNIGEYLKKIKLNDINKENLLKLKKQLIYDENTILGLRAICYIPSTKFNYLTQNTPPDYFITNSNTEYTMTIQNNIQTVYFIKLDLYKYQQNFKGPETELVVSL